VPGSSWDPPTTALSVASVSVSRLSCRVHSRVPGRTSVPMRRSVPCRTAQRRIIRNLVPCRSTGRDRISRTRRERRSCLASHFLRGAFRGPSPQKLALHHVQSQRRGPLELGTRLFGSAEFPQQIAADGRQQVVRL